MKSLGIPFEFLLVADDEGFETEDVNVAFIFEGRNDGLGELAFLKDVHEDGGEVLIFGEGSFVVLIDVVFVDFFSEFPHAFFAVGDVVDERRVHLALR